MEQKIANGEHSPFGASIAHRWTVCHGSVQACEGVADEPSEYALEGTVGHKIAAQCLEAKQDAIEYAGRVIDGIEIDDTLVEGVQTYLDAIRQDQATHGGKLLIECKFHLKELHPMFWGTADCVRIGTDTLSVYDLKLGRGHVVEVMKGNEPNVQLGYYALGAIYALERPLHSLGIKKVELIVVQPRAWHKDGPVRRATFEIEELRWLETVLVDAAKECEKPDAKFVVGDHCEFCRIAGTCKALRDYSFEVAQFDFDQDWGERTVNPVTMNNEELSMILDAIDIIEMWISAVRTHAHLLAQTPQGLPGWKLVEKQARRKWINEATAANELSLDFGVDEAAMYERKLLSPAQVEKLITPADRKSTAFTALWEKRSSGTTLVRSDHPKPAAPLAPEREFIGETGDW